MKILMIEDQPLFSDLIAHTLEGLDIDVVQTLGAAKEKLNSRRYDMVLVDLGLPDSQGLNTLRSLQRYKVPKVVLTARFDVSDEAAELGAMDYILKTTDMVDLYERIMFNISKIKSKTPRFAPNIFAQLKECVASSREWMHPMPLRELTHA